MNPGSFFREVFESHEFWLSDTIFGINVQFRAAGRKMSDKANLLDIVGSGKAGRFAHHIVDESAVRD